MSTAVLAECTEMHFACVAVELEFIVVMFAAVVFFYFVLQSHLGKVGLDIRDLLKAAFAVDDHFSRLVVNELKLGKVVTFRTNCD